MYAVRWAVSAGMLLRVQLESQPQQLCGRGRVVSINCARPRGSATFTGEILIGQSLRHHLDMAAVDAMKRWRFKPATRNGQPIAAAVFVEMSFHLP